MKPKPFNRKKHRMWVSIMRLKGTWRTLIYEPDRGADVGEKPYKTIRAAYNAAYTLAVEECLPFHYRNPSELEKLKKEVM